jgi:hypothetical protein
MVYIVDNTSTLIALLLLLLLLCAFTRVYLLHNNSTATAAASAAAIVITLHYRQFHQLQHLHLQLPHFPVECKQTVHYVCEIHAIAALAVRSRGAVVLLRQFDIIKTHTRSGAGIRKYSGSLDCATMM